MLEDGSEGGKDGVMREKGRRGKGKSSWKRGRSSKCFISLRIKERKESI